MDPSPATAGSGCRSNLIGPLLECGRGFLVGPLPWRRPNAPTFGDADNPSGHKAPPTVKEMLPMPDGPQGRGPSSPVPPCGTGRVPASGPAEAPKAKAEAQRATADARKIIRRKYFRARRIRRVRKFFRQENICAFRVARAKSAFQRRNRGDRAGNFRANPNTGPPICCPPKKSQEIIKSRPNSV